MPPQLHFYNRECAAGFIAVTSKCPQDVRVLTRLPCEAFVVFEHAGAAALAIVVDHRRKHIRPLLEKADRYPDRRFEFFVLSCEQRACAVCVPDAATVACGFCHVLLPDRTAAFRAAQRRKLSRLRCVFRAAVAGLGDTHFGFEIARRRRPHAAPVLR